MELEFFLTFAEGGERGQDTQLGSPRSMSVNVRERLSAGLTLEIDPTVRGVPRPGLARVLSNSQQEHRGPCVALHHSGNSWLWRRPPGTFTLLNPVESPWSPSFLSSEQPWHWITLSFVKNSLSFSLMRRHILLILFPPLWLILFDKFVSQLLNVGGLDTYSSSPFLFLISHSFCFYCWLSTWQTHCFPWLPPICQWFLKFSSNRTFPLNPKPRAKCSVNNLCCLKDATDSACSKLHGLFPQVLSSFSFAHFRCKSPVFIGNLARNFGILPNTLISSFCFSAKDPNLSPNPEKLTS